MHYNYGNARNKQLDATVDEVWSSCTYMKYNMRLWYNRLLYLIKPTVVCICC